LNRKERAALVHEGLRRVIEKRTTELDHGDPFELLVATLLSAQCTDERVNTVTPALFRAFPDAASMSKAEPEQIFPFIRSISYPNNKSKHLAKMARQVMENFDGRIPETVQKLETLAGVGHKTAQVVAGIAFGVPTLAVDTHIFRVAHRIGLVTDAPTPLHVERQLKRLLPVDDWGEMHHLLILHGRYHCTARSPLCETCPIQFACKWYSQLAKLPGPVIGLNQKLGRYYCATRKHYFAEPDHISDRAGLEQLSCPKCGSMNVFDTRTGKTSRRIKDYRI